MSQQQIKPNAAGELFSPRTCWTCWHSRLDISGGSREYLCAALQLHIECNVNSPTDCPHWDHA